MKSSFFEFHVASSGLFTAKANLQVTSHNVANAQTVGFSRQYAEQRACWPLTFYNGKGMIGTGSEVYGVGQHRDFYLDKKYWSERGVLGEYSVKKTQMQAMESVFNDISENGLTGVFNSFWDCMQQLSENSGDSTYRTNLLQAAQSVISLVRLEASAFQKQQQDINSEVSAVADKINSIGQQIASLNRQIYQYEMDGSKANDLRDSRARLVDELSLYVNVQVSEKEMNEDYAAGKYPDPEDRNKSDKRFVVTINGKELVNHFDACKFETRPRMEGHEEADEVIILPRDLVTAAANTTITLPSANNMNPGEVIKAGSVVTAGSIINGAAYGVDTTIGADITVTGQTVLAAGTTVPLTFNNKVTIGGTTYNKGDVVPAGITLPAGTVVSRYTPPYDEDIRIDGIDPGADHAHNPMDIPGLYDVYLNGVKFDLYSQNLKGELKGLIDVRDGNAAQTVIADSDNPNAGLSVYDTSFKGIPYYMNQLNEMVRIFARALNEGVDADGNPMPGVTGFKGGHSRNPDAMPTGQLFFTMKPDASGVNAPTQAELDAMGLGLDYNRMNIFNFAVNQKLIDEPSLLTAALEGSPSLPSDESDNRVVLGLLKLREYTHLFKQGKLSDFINSMSSDLGTDLKQASAFESNYTDVTTMVDNQRMEVSGVDVNEEMINMVKYQQLYQAAAKLMNIIDSIYDITVNRLGTW
ncbi:MAG: flagellar hook-associated protein FlgK [Clostridiales bacterium]|jgi:flagellar hook-associated protein 1 FlgK|nr:flagellar hook-associated protein FlgK [Clostridiales bacterium]